MAQITWKNIAVPDMGSALDMAGEAYDSFGDSLDPIKDIIDRRQTQKDVQYNKETVAINTDIQNNLQQFKTLAEFNEAEDQGLLDDGIFTEKYGDRYDKGAFEISKKDIWTKLQGEAQDDAYAVGNIAADEAQDVDAGIAAASARMLELGGRTRNNMQAVTQYGKSSAYKQGGYDDQKQEDTNAFMASIGPQNSPQAIEKIKDQANAQGLDGDVIGQKLTQEMTANRNNRTYQRGESERINMNKFNNGMMAAIDSGSDPKEAYRAWAKKSNLTGSQKRIASGLASDYYIQQSKPTQDEQLILAQNDQNAASTIKKKTTEINAHITDLKQQRVGLTGLSENILSIADESFKQSGGIVGTIMKDLTDTGVEPTDWYTDLKTSPKRVAAILNDKYTQFKKIPGIGDREAAGLLWLSYQDSVGDSYGWGGAKGVAPKALDGTSIKREEQFNKGEDLKAQIAEDTLSAEKFIDQAETDRNNYAVDSLISTRESNRTGKDIPIPSFDLADPKFITRSKEQKLKKLNRQIAEQDSAEAKKEADRRAELHNKETEDRLKMRITNYSQKGYLNQKVLDPFMEKIKANIQKNISYE